MSPSEKQLPGEVLSTHEMAKQVRECALDLFEFGALGSDFSIPREATRGTVKIPLLLKYSPQTVRHLQTLQQTLNVPREFQITQKPNQKWDYGKPSSDVIYHREKVGDIYTFPHQLTPPELDPLAATLHAKEREQPTLHITIVRYSGGKTLGRGKTRELIDTWEVKYYYSTPMPGTLAEPLIYRDDYLQRHLAKAKRDLGIGTIRGDIMRMSLLSFFFTRKSVKPSFFINAFYPKIVQKAISPVGITRTGPNEAFEVHQLFLDAEKMEKMLAKKDRPDPRPEVKYTELEAARYVQSQLGSRPIQFVNLGTAEVGNRTFHMYTSPETPMVTERAPSAIQQAKFVPNRSVAR